MDTDNLNISFSSCPQSVNFQREFYFKGNIKLKRQGMMTYKNHNFELSGISKVQVEIFFFPSLKQIMSNVTKNQRFKYRKGIVLFN